MGNNPKDMTKLLNEALDATVKIHKYVMTTDIHPVRDRKASTRR